MGIADRLKDLKTKAVDATAERSDKLHEAVDNLAATADQHTGGKYREQIQKAGEKAGSLVDGIAGSGKTADAESAQSTSGDSGEGAPAPDPPGAPAPDSAGAPAPDA